MTEQEAIKILSKDTSMEAVNELTYYAGFNREKVIEQIQEAMDMGANAIEKQIPKKPTFVDVRFRYHGKYISDGQSLCKCYKCPNCNTHIFHVWDDEKHCKCCGQKIDWTVEE